MAFLAGLGVVAAGIGAAANIFRDAEQQGQVQFQDPLIIELTNKMDDFEDAEFNRLGPSVGGLYIHWFFSFLALIECICRLIVCGVIIFAWSLVIYLTCCLSCGKSVNMPAEPFIVVVAGRYGIYSTFLCALVANVLCPFAPTLYFWKRRVVCLRPPGVPRKRALKTDQHMCCTCPEFGHALFIQNGVAVPTWKMAQVYLSTVAVLHILGVFHGCNGSSWASLCVVRATAEAYLDAASQAIIMDSNEDTMRFFRGAYGVDNFEGFLARQHGQWGGAASYEPTAPPAFGPPPRPPRDHIPVQAHVIVPGSIPVVIATPVPRE